MSKIAKNINENSGDFTVTLSDNQCLVMRGDGNDANITIGKGHLSVGLNGDENDVNNASGDNRISTQSPDTNWNEVVVNGDENDVNVNVKGDSYVGIVMTGDENDITVKDPMPNSNHANLHSSQTSDGTNIIINDNGKDVSDDDDNDGCGCSTGCSGWLFGILVAAAIGVYFHSWFWFLISLAAVIAIGWIIDAIVSVSIIAIVVEVIKKIYHDLK